MADDDPDIPAARRRKAFMLAAEYGLDRDDRLSLAQMLLHRDVTSWKDLDDAQVCRVLDALEGAQLVGHLRSLKV